LERLPETRREQLRREINGAASRDGLVEALLYTQFADKKMILRNNPCLKMGKDKFESEIDKIRKLRDGVAHANEYAASLEAASETCRTVRLIDKWAAEFSQWLQAAG